ncbi:MAG: hypothetical protein J3Q66DRAFT_436392 [Benniella sp.]|nr:MAG: hypothetical protein J3Q66DRAFT_436392 [Benniella sp.]
MDHFATKAPDVFGKDALISYGASLSAFYQARNNALAAGTVFTGGPPSLPDPEETLTGDDKKSARPPVGVSLGHGSVEKTETYCREGGNRHPKHLDTETARTFENETSTTGSVSVVELPSIVEMEGSLLHSYQFEILEVYQEGLKQFHYVFKTLTWFYTSKNDDGDGQRQALIVYGNGQFNTSTRLATLHDSFKGYFFPEARGIK